MKKILLIFLPIVLSSCLLSNIHIMPDYEGKQIDGESLMVIETVLCESGDIALLNYNSSFYGWNKAFSLSIDKKENDKLGGLEILSINSAENLFSKDKDSLKIYPSYLNIAKDLKEYSRFKNVYNYSGRSCAELTKQKLELNKEDHIEIALPLKNHNFALPNDSVKYLLFIQMPDELYAENGKLVLKINFCFWNAPASEIVSYGRFNSITTSGYDFNIEDVKYEIIRRILIETPFYKGKFGSRVKF